MKWLQNNWRPKYNQSARSDVRLRVRAIDVAIQQYRPQIDSMIEVEYGLLTAQAHFPKLMPMAKKFLDEMPEEQRRRLEEEVNKRQGGSNPADVQATYGRTFFDIFDIDY